MSKKNRSGDPRKRNTENNKDGLLLKSEIIKNIENDFCLNVYESMELKTKPLLDYLFRFCENSKYINRNIVKTEYLNLLNQKDDYWYQHIVNWFKKQEFNNLFTGKTFKSKDVCNNIYDVLKWMLLTHSDQDLINLFWNCPEVKRCFDLN